MLRKLFLSMLTIQLLLHTGCSSLKQRHDGFSQMLEKPFSGSNNDSETQSKQKKVVRRARLDADAERVFSYLTNFEIMDQWMPGLSEVRVDNQHSLNGPEAVGVGTERICKAYGMEAHELIVEFNAPQSFTYVLTQDSSAGVPFKSGKGEVSVIPLDEESCTLTYEVTYETKPFHPMSAVMPIMLGKQLGGGMDNLVQLFGGQRLD